MPEQRIVVLVGLPGSGKSTWVAQQGGVAISSDELRRWLKDDATDQSIHGLVFKLMRDLVRHRLAHGITETYVDATNQTPKTRRAIKKISDHKSARCEAVFFDVPLEECLRRNVLRSRTVPEAAIRAMALKLEPPSLEEGFASIHNVVR